MLKTMQKSLTGIALRDAGWNALVKSIGLINATRFILQYETCIKGFNSGRQENNPL
jgi:hypothetical protein